MRIKNFKLFNEGSGSVITSKVPQFDILKTLIIILTDGNLMNQIFHMLPDVDLEQALHNTSMLDNTQVETLNQIYNTIILNDYTLRKKYDMLPDNAQDIQ